MKVFLLTLIFISSTVLAEETAKTENKPITVKKTQKIDFEEEAIDGEARKPDGSYLVEKRGVDFVPLYKVRERFDESMKSSVEYLK